jgi:hypothetical protein
MVGIIKKNFYTFRFNILIYLLVSLCYIGAYLYIKLYLFEGIIPDASFTRIALAFLPLIMVMQFNTNAFQLDFKKSMYERYTNSLPVSSLCITIGKFISSLLVTFLGFIVSCVCYIIFSAMDKSHICTSGFTAIAIGFFIVIIFLAFQLPVLVYSGNVLLSYVFPIVLFSFIMIYFCIVKGNDPNNLIINVSSFLTSHIWLKNNLTLITFSLTVLICVLSVTLSNYIYKRRDF